MSEHERLRKALEERDITRLRLKKARGALRRVIKALQEPHSPKRDQHIQRIAISGCGTPKKRKRVSMPGQIDLIEWINAQ